MAANLTRKLEKMALTGEKEKEYGNVALAQKLNPGTSGTRVNLSTNLKRVEIAEKTPIYKYDVSIILYFPKSDGTFAENEVSKSRAKDTQHLHDVEKCENLYRLAVQKNQRDFGKGDYFYDRQASLYAFQLLQNAGAEVTYTFKATDVPFIKDIAKATITIKPVDKSFQTTSDDVSKTVKAAPKHSDKTLLEALNTVINSSAVESENVITYKHSVHYLLDPSCAGFVPQDFLRIPRSYLYSGVGLKTAVKTLEGEKTAKTKDDPSLYVVAEIKKTVFHENHTLLLDKLSGTGMFDERMSIGYMAAVSNRIKGILCYMNYGNNRGSDGQLVKLLGLGPVANSPSSEFIASDGKKYTVAGYFARKYNIKLSRPGLPTVHAQGRKKMNLHLPVELLSVAESQIAKTEQLTGFEQEAAIKNSAMKPADRKRQTEAVSMAMGITGANIGGVVKVADQSEMVVGRVLNTPRMFFAGKKEAVVQNKSSWRGTEKYYEAVSVSNWQIHVIGTDSSFDHQEFIKRLKRTMESKGINFSDPTVFHHSEGRMLKNIFADADRHSVRYLFFIVRDHLDLHQDIKANEQLYDIVTQEVREKTARNVIVKRQNLTLENVVNKMNIKLNGLNFVVIGSEEKQAYANDPDVAFIGFETTQRTSSDGPIMVGYSANVLNHPQKYAGGYYYVPKNKDVFGPVIKKVIRRVIQKISATRGKKPLKLVLFFNGVSEGQWPLINEEYSQQVKDACKEFDVPNNGYYRPAIIIMAVSKMHNERLYRQEIDKTGKASQQNITPGTCVDTKIVSPVVSEFYLTAQNAFQGTAKSPKFSLIFSTVKVSMDVLEQMTYQLCFLHEIVNASVSLPIPLVIADRFAKRAGMNFRKHEERHGRKDVYNYEQLNRDLGYDGKVLDFTRFNA